MEKPLKRHRKSLKVAHLLTIAFVSLSAIVLIIASALQGVSNYQYQRQILDKEQRIEAQAAANTVSTFIQERLGSLRTTARYISVTAATPEDNRMILDSLLGLEPAFRQVVWLDAGGQALARTSRLSQAGSGQLDEKLSPDVIAQIRQADKYIGSVYIDNLTSEPLALIMVPIANAYGDFQGALLAEVNLKFMWDLLDQIRIGEMGYAYVVDENGRLLAFGDTGRVLQGESLAGLPKVAEFIGGVHQGLQPETEEFIGIYETKVLGTYVPLGEPNWAVMTELPSREAYQPVYEGLVVSAAITLGMVIMAGLMGFLMASRLSLQIINLTTMATRVAAGDLDVRISTHGPVEVVFLAEAFNTMTAQLKQILENLEQRVAERTRMLAASTEVSRRLSTILDTNQLIKAVVDQLQNAFHYYHVHVYLFDEQGEKLLLMGGTGEAGAKMLENQHQIAKGSGLVGKAAQTGVPILISDVLHTEGWLPNPLLPETKSELAVPIAIGENVLGVLDVQQNQVGGLKQEDVELLQSIANQVAVALQNARTYAQIRRRANREAQVSAISQRIQRTSSPEEALQVAAREIGRALGSDYTLVRLKTRSENGGEGQQ